ncbi:MAG: ABC transporter ATP-binding protein [Chloroflexota bacterium]|nr:ABC transporter ATP-binding protein [Chloroflexota bacterium]MDE2949042.1 ABC transporter ATP-binding protein [Chloroflexota bacterium]
MAITTRSLLDVERLTISYEVNKRWIPAVRDFHLRLRPGQIVGLVGESGSGKSTIALALMRYLSGNGRVESGGLLRFAGEDLLRKSDAEMRRLWAKRVKFVPQNAGAALNPSIKIGPQVAEALKAADAIDGDAAYDTMMRVFHDVRLADPERVAERYPHELSGGMQQRVTIAMALISNPELLIMDEPTTGLDVTTEAAILDLVRGLIAERGTGVIYISHNLGVIAQLCERVVVLYAGEIMEEAPVLDLFQAPRHPYTLGLISSVPKPGQSKRAAPLQSIAGNPPALTRLPGGCVFAERCAWAIDICRDKRPPLEQLADKRAVRCHRWEELSQPHPPTPSPRHQMPAIEIAGRGTTKPIRRPAPDAKSATEQAKSPSIAMGGDLEGGWQADETLLRADNLNKAFPVPRSLRELLARTAPSPIRAVDGVDLHLRAGRTLGLVGESGSGKTTLARLIIGLEERSGGKLELLGMDVRNHVRDRSQDVLSKIQMVFQNPQNSLNPYLSVRQAIRRPLIKLRRFSPAEADAEALALLARVNLRPEYADRYPDELSGGEKQRVAIARAFASDPDLIICDEPVSALDVSVQSAVLNLLAALQDEHGSAYLFISHNLSVVGYLADTIAVMYLGQLVEVGEARELFQAPYHPYSEALVSAIPVADPRHSTARILLSDDLPSAQNLPSGCRFHTRCPRKIGEICEREEPPWRPGDRGHLIRCHIPLEELTSLQSGSNPLEKAD